MKKANSFRRYEIRAFFADGSSAVYDADLLQNLTLNREVVKICDEMSAEVIFERREI